MYYGENSKGWEPEGHIFYIVVRKHFLLGHYLSRKLKKQVVKNCETNIAEGGKQV